MNGRVKAVIATVLGAALLGNLGFYMVEARDEVYFLCGNFKQGVPASSVVRQLNTIELSNYTINELPMGKRIVHSSAIHLNSIRCTIDIDANDEVVSATYTSFSD